MRLVACKKCHSQYDVTAIEDASITCACGSAIANRPLRSLDATIERCGSCGAAVSVRDASCTYCRSPLGRDARDLSLICPECFARNPDGGLFCTHCGVAFAPQPLTHGGVTLDCPACARELVARAAGGVPVHECPGCLGVWVPGEAFDAIVRKALSMQSPAASGGLGAAPAPAAAPSERSAARGDWRVEYRKCPACGGRMQRRNYGRRSGVIVDWCGSHGTWLDADELGAIASFITRGGLEAQHGDGLEGRARLSAAESRATAEAERIMAGERTAQAHRRRKLAEGSVTSSILELLSNLIRR